MRSAVIEAETREEVMKEMEERMLAMEKKFALRLRKEVCVVILLSPLKRPKMRENRLKETK